MSEEVTVGNFRVKSIDKGVCDIETGKGVVKIIHTGEYRMAAKAPDYPGASERCGFKNAVFVSQLGKVGKFGIFCSKCGKKIAEVLR